MSLSNSDGGCGLAVKAPDCGSGYRGFESRQPPCRHFSSLAHLLARSGRTNRHQRRGEPHHPPRIGFVHDPSGRAPMIQIQATTSFALIPVGLRLAPFATSGTPVALARWVPGAEASTHHGEGLNTPGALTRCSRLHRTHPTSPRICHPPSGICHPPSLHLHSAFRKDDRSLLQELLSSPTTSRAVPRSMRAWSRAKTSSRLALPPASTRDPSWQARLHKRPDRPQAN